MPSQDSSAVFFPRTHQWLLLLIFVLTLIVCPKMLWAAEEGQNALPLVRMASLQNDLHHLPLWVAEEQGFFEAEGVKVAATATFRAGPELMSGILAGSIDMAYVGEAPATITFARGSKVHVVAQVNIGGSALVVAKDSKATKLADLTRIAVPGNGTVQDFLLRRSQRAAGVKAKDQRILTLPPSEMAVALKNGQIDGFIAWQPFPARAVVRGEGRILADSLELWPNHPCCVLVATEKALNSGSAQKVVRAHCRAILYIKEHPKEALLIAKKRTGMDEATIEEALTHVVYRALPAVAEEEEYVRFLQDFGYIKQRDPKAFTADFIHSLVDAENK